MDGEFKPLENMITEARVNVVFREVHVPEAERNIRTIKDRTRNVLASLPFKRIPNRIVIELVFGQVFWLNAFANKYGISKSLSPRIIMTGYTIDFKKNVRIVPGQYGQTHEEHNNDMRARTVAGIALRPAGNEQGGHYFLSRPTGRMS